MFARAVGAASTYTNVDRNVPASDQATPCDRIVVGKISAVYASKICMSAQSAVGLPHLRYNLWSGTNMTKDTYGHGTVLHACRSPYGPKAAMLGGQTAPVRSDCDTTFLLPGCGMRAWKVRERLNCTYSNRHSRPVNVSLADLQWAMRKRITPGIQTHASGSTHHINATAIEGDETKAEKYTHR